MPAGANHSATTQATGHPPRCGGGGGGDIPRGGGDISMGGGGSQRVGCAIPRGAEPSSEEEPYPEEEPVAQHLQPESSNEGEEAAEAEEIASTGAPLPAPPPQDTSSPSESSSTSRETASPPEELPSPPPPPPQQHGRHPSVDRIACIGCTGGCLPWNTTSGWPLLGVCPDGTGLKKNNWVITSLWNVTSQTTVHSWMILLPVKGEIYLYVPSLPS
ncbi:uncharacterized protein [Pyxicephalus adspersus]|uniref:uncharacterized protein isoform X1 n=2 Tax=Pyxicephalus adspersus TaxID=30357 RepID=UPI003B5A310D